ncbi:MULTISPECIES: hypothetical protein [Flavobacteriaceae]|uniref:CcmD family protein n=2 Tax=Flavobacteriaceae TaxID=49546 RepID=A0ABN1JCF6_9FLAO|nr:MULTISPECIES: hypothetical protein [Flavobacteriaceae]TBV25171.1 hypothetical protein DMZ43_12735 [Meridianimaribacter sp. CL38]TDY10586.1 hypothetical protein A8975_2313 [Meridianimaribacter flavus]
MKIFTIIVTVIAIALIIFNITQVDVNAPFEGQSVIALITILTSLCAIVLLQILRTSKLIEKKTKENK